MNPSFNLTAASHGTPKKNKPMKAPMQTPMFIRPPHPDQIDTKKPGQQLPPKIVGSGGAVGKGLLTRGRTLPSGMKQFNKPLLPNQQRLVNNKNVNEELDKIKDQLRKLNDNKTSGKQLQAKALLPNAHQPAPDLPRFSPTHRERSASRGRPKPDTDSMNRRSRSISRSVQGQRGRSSAQRSSSKADRSGLDLTSNLNFEGQQPRSGRSASIAREDLPFDLNKSKTKKTSSTMLIASVLGKINKKQWRTVFKG